PQPQVIAATAADPDIEDGQPAPRGEAGQRAEKPLPGGEHREEPDRGKHGDGAHRQRRISFQVRPVQDPADGTAHRSQEHGELADPRADRAGPLERLLPERQPHARERQQHPGELRERQSLLAERRRDDHRQQRERGEDQRRADRRNEPEPVVQQRDEDAELGDPEQADREQIAPVEPRARPPSPPPDWLTMSRERPYDILRARRNSARACPPAIIKERSLPQRTKRAPTPTYFSMVGWS